MRLIELTHLISAILMIAIPILLAIYLRGKIRMSWGIWAVGGFTFILSQVGHIPFNIALDILFERGWLPSPPPAWGVVFSAVFLGLSSGLWEEWFRWIAYRWWVPQARSWKNAIALGAGHGGMEAILLGVLSLANLLNVLLLKGKDLALIVSEVQVPIVQRQLESYWSLPWYFPLLGPVERLFTLPFHITASVLVLQAFRRGQMRWVWLSVLWHALMNALVAVILPTLLKDFAWWPYAVEGILGLFALFNIGILFLLRTPEVETEIPSRSTVKPVQLIMPRRNETTKEDLNQTRYFEQED